MSREQFEAWYMDNWGFTEDDIETLFERSPDCPEDYYRLGVRLAHHSWLAATQHGEAKFAALALLQFSSQSQIDAGCYKHGMEASNARLIQVAAENSALKLKGRELLGEACSVYEKFNATVDNEVGNFADGQTLQEFDFLLSVGVPSTDAFLAEVRANAVDEACLKISNAIVNCCQDEQIGLDAAATICGDFAAQLRQEAAQ